MKYIADSCPYENKGLLIAFQWLFYNVAHISGYLLGYLVFINMQIFDYINTLFTLSLFSSMLFFQANPNPVKSSYHYRKRKESRKSAIHHYREASLHEYVDVDDISQHLYINTRIEKTEKSSTNLDAKDADLSFFDSLRILFNQYKDKRMLMMIPLMIFQTSDMPFL